MKASLRTPAKLSLKPGPEVPGPGQAPEPASEPLRTPRRASNPRRRTSSKDAFRPASALCKGWLDCTRARAVKAASRTASSGSNSSERSRSAARGSSRAARARQTSAQGPGVFFSARCNSSPRARGSPSKARPRARRLVSSDRLRAGLHQGRQVVLGQIRWTVGWGHEWCSSGKCRSKNDRRWARSGSRDPGPLSEIWATCSRSWSTFSGRSPIVPRALDLGREILQGGSTRPWCCRWIWSTCRGGFHGHFFQGRQSPGLQLHAAAGVIPDRAVAGPATVSPGCRATAERPCRRTSGSSSSPPRREGRLDAGIVQQLPLEQAATGPTVSDRPWGLSGRPGSVRANRQETPFPGSTGPRHKFPAPSDSRALCRWAMAWSSRGPVPPGPARLSGPRRPFCFEGQDQGAKVGWSDPAARRRSKAANRTASSAWFSPPSRDGTARGWGQSARSWQASSRKAWSEAAFICSARILTEEASAKSARARKAASRALGSSGPADSWPNLQPHGCGSPPPRTCPPRRGEKSGGCCPDRRQLLGACPESRRPPGPPPFPGLP